MARIGIIQSLRATHGSNRHEHTFKIEFVFEGQIKNGFVEGIDFHTIKPIIEGVLSPLIDTYLPESLGVERASVENLAIYLFKKLAMKNLYAIQIWEEVDRYAIVFADDFR
ncbi:MAG: 6-carboxytetrahydropterin synthase [Candidatus Peribacteria bacterium]|jgi:6-pyruvoyl-tetrahydropterin synthase|nr:6-carboxytetrahydropterin synthase [Candidatus Peribacteria bacterium]